ncbi:unnamed protein product [Zymoseptoria tritici ST99CH_1E4]|uniref:PH domain-containing protein n=1 Tax=Zymoseptoria tritici ST99CH_1E4 TaxID=1276532 RepID=A0A2H1GJ02_ZYMTR|nr:unnamed protein product [Zymoseptoria tritici ST99CH_1E4]
MADYFSDFSTYVGPKGLPSPADTPFETSAFVRSKRTSRTMSGQDRSTTPPPHPSTDSIDLSEKPARDSRYSSMDPRRFTPTLHASLVSEILNLRREIDSKNNLVENLETSLLQSKEENDELAGKLSETTKEVRKAKQQVQQLEQGTIDAVEGLVKERDTAKSAFHELRSKFEVTQKKTRLQDNDAIRAHSIWESEKESWDNERRQLERRVHVTESRLRAVLDEMATIQSTTQPLQLDGFFPDGSTFKDSGIGDGIGSDTTSIRTASPTKRRRSARKHVSVSSMGTMSNVDMNGVSLADELDIDEEDEFDMEGSEHGEEESIHAVGTKQSAATHRRTMSREQSSKLRFSNGWRDSLRNGNATSAPFRVVQISQGTDTDELQDLISSAASVRPLMVPLVYVDSGYQPEDRSVTPPAKLPAAVYKDTGCQSSPTPRFAYVDSGFQPSPPPSPARAGSPIVESDKRLPEQFSLIGHVRPSDSFDSTLQTRVAASPISPPETPVMNDGEWTPENSTTRVAPVYRTTSTQTDVVQPEKRWSNVQNLSPSMFVPSISIHPPTSRPSSPRPHVLPPGTRNASSQANLAVSYKDVCMQTEEIRVDSRPVKLAPHLLLSHPMNVPSALETSLREKALNYGSAQVLPKPSAVLQGPFEPEIGMTRHRGGKAQRGQPLKALSLPRPVLSPATNEPSTNGPLHRSSQYGVNQDHKPDASLGADGSPSDEGDDEDEAGAHVSRPPQGRFALSGPPKAVPEDKEISPERRPKSAGGAPAASVSGGRAAIRAARHTLQSLPAKDDGQPESSHARTTSAGSLAMSSKSAPTGLPLPPFPIPTRSSSRVIGNTKSEGSESPLSSYGYYEDRGTRKYRSAHHSRQHSLRKVQSAAVIRHRTSKSAHSSPKKAARRRMRSPELTPINSLLIDSPSKARDFAANHTNFPIPELPKPLHNSMLPDTGSVMSNSTSTAPRLSEENNLVDAIAGTMVGEWMWKYVRKRKSIMLGDDTAGLAAAAEQNGFMNGTGHGTRHKRWVWLSPYERTIMWDGKQPASGPALLGKKGRKLPIQSVLDVPDTSSLPKVAELPTAFHRSILILTPERALKFTATTEERHSLWMTALTFLARSQSQGNPRIPRLPFKSPPPPIPANNNSIDGVSVNRFRSPSFGRTPLRDSIRLAKGKRPDLNHLPHHPSNMAANPDSTNSMDASRESSADFPAVPRLYITTSRHQRKRSQTNPLHPRDPASLSSNLRSFTSSIVPSSTASVNGGGSTFRPSFSSKAGSRRDSSTASPDQPNFFEAVGTVRMEAFVDPNVRDGVRYVPNLPGALGSGPRTTRHSRNLSQSTVEKRRAGFVFDEMGTDPFKGF